MHTLERKKWLFVASLLVLSICTFPAMADEDDVDDDDRHDDYDLFDRNRDQADFGPYNFPDDKEPNNPYSIYYPYPEAQSQPFQQQRNQNQYYRNR